MKHCFIETDLSQAEWVVTAHCCGDVRMLDVVKIGRDPHLRTGSMISGAPEGFVKFEDDLVGHLTDPVELRGIRQKSLPQSWEGISIRDFFLPHNMSIRQAGKKGNHGLNYGMEYKRFALENGMMEDDAAHIVRIYRDIAYPGIKLWYTETQNQLRDNNRQLTNCFGQSRKFMAKWDIELFMAAYAFIPQSTVGNITNRGMRGIYHYSNKNVDLAAQVHDSILTHHKFNSWNELANQVIFCDRVMTQTCEYRDVKFVIDRDIKLGVNWGGEVMKKVNIQDLNKVSENLRLAYEKSCEEAKAA